MKSVNAKDGIVQESGGNFKKNDTTVSTLNDDRPSNTLSFKLSVKFGFLLLHFLSFSPTQNIPLIQCFA